jgi:hypothetical protein
MGKTHLRIAIHPGIPGATDRAAPPTSECRSAGPTRARGLPNTLQGRIRLPKLPLSLRVSLDPTVTVRFVRGRGSHARLGREECVSEFVAEERSWIPCQSDYK